jgi:predicted permease
LLVTKVAVAIDLRSVVELWIFPVSALVFILAGFAMGGAVCLLTGVSKGRRSAVIAASGLANSGYLPIPLIVAVCAVFPAFADRPDAGARGITFISAYIMLFSPFMWLFGYNLLSSEKSWRLDFKRVFTPPIIGMIIGLTIGLTPSLKSVFCLRTGFCYPIFAALEILAAGTIPCALMRVCPAGLFIMKDRNIDNINITYKPIGILGRRTKRRAVRLYYCNQIACIGIIGYFHPVYG